MSSQVKSNQVTFAYAALSPREQGLCFIDTGITDHHIRTLTPAYSVKVKGLCHCWLVHFVKNANNASVIRYGT